MTKERVKIFDKNICDVDFPKYHKKIIQYSIIIVNHSKYIYMNEHQTIFDALPVKQKMHISLAFCRSSCLSVYRKFLKTEI